MITKILLFLAFLAIVISVLFTTDTFEPLINLVVTSLSLSSSTGRLFTKDELSKFTGIDNSGVYLAIIGQVFDVTKGRKHYGEGGGYHFFTGNNLLPCMCTKVLCGCCV